MFSTGLRQLRVAFATALGRPVPAVTLQRLVADARATLDEFGSAGEDAGTVLDGPYADPALRAHLQTAALRRTAKYLATRSAFYRQRFAAAGVDPARLSAETMRAVPPTSREHLVPGRRDLVCGAPFLSARTTGTTGPPAEVWLSRDELARWPALIALSVVLRGELGARDHVMVCRNPLAAAAVQMDVEMCRLAGAACSVVGLVAPDEALDRMCGPPGSAPSVLITYPSYLGSLVTAARDRGLGPGDFALHTVNTGGEMLSAALARAATETLGARVNDGYGATELFPVGGRTCSREHLHIDPNLGYTEVLDLATGTPAEPGVLGRLVVTPYFPYRECQPVFRYDTRDLVRVLDTGEAASCEMPAVPAVSRILGRAVDLMPAGVTPRDVVEALDALPGARWPVRFAASSDSLGLRLTVADSSLADGIGASEVAAALAARGLDARVSVGDQAQALRPLRVPV